MKPKAPDTLRDGARCRVVGGTHAGKSGIVRDIKTSRTGHVTITVVQASGVRFKTLARNVAIQPQAAKRREQVTAIRSRRGAAKPKLLAGGNPQISKADGDAPVQAYIAAMPGWKSRIGRRIDTLIVRTVRGVRKAVKWNSPFYGTEGRGWFLSFHTFTNCVKVTFFRGTSLRPVPSGGKARDARWIDIHEDDLDEAQLTTWIRQAAALPGWGKS